MLITVIKYQNQASTLSCGAKWFAPDMPMSFKKVHLLLIISRREEFLWSFFELTTFRNFTET